jgi:hypothetical protein
MILVGQDDAVLPLLQSPSFADLAENQRAEEIVALTDVLVPNRKDKRLLVQVVRSRLEEKLFIKNRIQIAPLDARLVFLPIRVRP